MNGNDNIKSSNKIGCQHLNDIVAHPPFLHADSGKTTWICLKVGLVVFRMVASKANVICATPN